MRGTLGRWTIQLSTIPLVFYICIMLPGRPRNQLPLRKPKGPPTPLRFPRVDKRVGPSRGSLGQREKPNSILRKEKHTLVSKKQKHTNKKTTKKRTITQGQKLKRCGARTELS